jgi:hypothetical protein
MIRRRSRTVRFDEGRHVAGSPRLLEKEHSWKRLLVTPDDFEKKSRAV